MRKPCNRVMVVEDDRALLELLVDYFEGEGIEAVAVEGAEQALARLTSGESLPDVILIDLRMPKVTGEQLLERLRATPGLAHLPVAVMSGDPARLAFTGGEGVPALAKPFTIDELNAVLAHHCEGFGADASP
jgi:CheY-like chemotaxis protein